MPYQMYLVLAVMWVTALMILSVQLWQDPRNTLYQFLVIFAVFMIIRNLTNWFTQRRRQERIRESRRTVRPTPPRPVVHDEDEHRIQE